jgi:choline dehydrogenase-like flavoprotein
MGEIQTETDSYGKLRNSTNIYITDSSLIPSPPGVNPQGILMTLVHRNINSLIDMNAFSNI